MYTFLIFFWLWLITINHCPALVFISLFFGTQRRRSHFSLHVLPYFPCLLSSIVWSIERLSLHCSSNREIMDLINWSLNAIDTIIYLFGTMITGILLIGLGFALGYRKIQKTGTAVQSLTRLPVWLKLWEERSALRLRLSIAIWILSRSSSLLYKGKLIDIRDQKWTKRVAVELECGYSPKQSQSYLFWLPRTSTGPARSLLEIYPWERTLQWDALASSPFYRHWYKLLHTHTHMHSLPLPPSLASAAFEPPAWQAGLWPAPRMAAGPDGCLVELDSPVAIVVCLWFMCFCWGVFPVLTLYSPRSIVWGLFFFSSLSSCYAVIFFNSLSSCPVYPLVICMLCMGRLMAYFTGTCD